MPRGPSTLPKSVPTQRMTDHFDTSTAALMPIYPAEFRGGSFSQYGEEGVIRKILQTLPQRDPWCVEFGAWDGVHLSIARSFILDDSYSAVLVEANPEKFQQLSANYKDTPRVHPLCQ